MKIKNTPSEFNIEKREDYFPGWWFQPIWKILYSQIGSFPQIGMKIKNIWNHHLVSFWELF